MCSGTKPISEQQSHLTAPSKTERNDEKIRKQEAIATVAAGALSLLLIAGGIALITFTAKIIHSSPPVTTYQIKGAAAGMYWGSALGVLGATVGVMTIYYQIKKRQKEEEHPSA